MNRTIVCDNGGDVPRPCCTHISRAAALRRNGKFGLHRIGVNIDIGGDEPYEA